MMSEAPKIARNRILAALGALIIMLVALMLFMAANSARISDQNARYLVGSTEQTARRVDDLLTNALGSIQTAAAVYEENMASDTIDPHEAVTHTHSTVFDSLFFITPEGVAYDDGDRVQDVADLPCFQQGMKGQGGVCAVEGELFGERNSMVFYAPLSHEGAVIGVICGVYREATLTQYITTYFFDEQTTTYLCDRDGSIVARSTVFEVHAANAFDIYAGNELNDLSLQDLEDAFREGRSISFTYDSSSGLGNAYLMKLPSYDWMLLRTFPESITNTMLENANAAGMILVLGTVIAAALFIVVLVVQARRQKKQLLLERREATSIIDASTNLFARMMAIDLDAGTYEYLKSAGVKDAVPLKGKFQDLRRYWVGLALPSDREAARQASDPEEIRRALASGVPYLQYEYRVLYEGQERWLQVSILGLERDSAQVPTGVLVTIQDVSDAKAQELAAHHALEEAFRAAEFASQAKSDFLNSMSHDIRTPMNSIMGMTAIASMHADDTERVKECLDNIGAASKHLLGLINEVLDMAKIESGTITLTDEPFDLPETVESLLTIIHPQVDAKGQSLKVELEAIEHEHVIGDPTRLQQVFVNIMGNAVKFTPEGGSLGLRIAELPSRAQGCACFEFTFWDTGCGMDEEFLKTIFDPFTRANDSRVTTVEGTGLGMSIVKSVINLMGGTIDVDSKVGEGTTFTVTVHLRMRDGVREDLGSLKGLRVLVVDNDQGACEGACAMLEDIGMDATFRLSGQEGIDEVARADERRQPYRAVILDWRMPGMSGIEAARIIRERVSRNIPIIILSGYDWNMIKQEAREVGVDAFISKPLFRSRLIQVMKDLVGGEVPDPAGDAVLLQSCAYQGRRILLTEDNDMAAAIAEEIIAMTGAEVERAQNGRIAVDKLLDHEPGYYDMVLMDIQMPVMNGYEATRAIREAASDRPDLGEIVIVALSADAFAEDVHHAGAAGMNAHMAKPLEIGPLVSMLRQWMPSVDAEENAGGADAGDL